MGFLPDGSENRCKAELSIIWHSCSSSLLGLDLSKYCTFLTSVYVGDLRELLSLAVIVWPAHSTFGQSVISDDLRIKELWKS